MYSNLKEKDFESVQVDFDMISKFFCKAEEVKKQPSAAQQN